MTTDLPEGAKARINDVVEALEQAEACLRSRQVWIGLLAQHDPKASAEVADARLNANAALMAFRAQWGTRL